jgi:EmrB/QacA subfamily drug resistance transporter
MAHQTTTSSDHRWLVLGLLCTAQLLVVLDATIVNIALPSIQSDLGFSDTNLQWVINAYVLTFGGLLLLGGRAADMFIRRNVFLAGLMVFVLASLACGLSGSEGTLIGGRALQGMGAAMMSAAALSILVVTFSRGKERNIALGVWGATSGVAGALGVILGGALTSGPGWEWVFFINVPIGLAAGAASLRFVAPHRAQERPPLDLVGALTATAGIGLLIFAIVRTEQEGWGSAATLGCIASAVALLAAFVAVEARHRAPLAPLGVFRLRNLSGGNAIALLLGSVMFATFFFVTL